MAIRGLSIDRLISLRPGWIRRTLNVRSMNDCEFRLDGLDDAPDEELGALGGCVHGDKLVGAEGLRVCHFDFCLGGRVRVLGL